jgi:hypothetical protein
MADLVYIPVDEESGEPYVWGTSEEPCISVFGDFWRCRQNPQSKGKAIRAVALEDVPGLLEGRWSHVAQMVYYPSADGYHIGKRKIKEMVAARYAALD